MSNGIKVKKRNGSIEPLALEKMHLMVEESCKDLAGVSASQVEMKSGFNFMMALPQEKFKRSLLSPPVILLIWIMLTISSLLHDSYSLGLEKAFTER